MSSGAPLNATPAWNREYIAAHPSSHLALCAKTVHAADEDRFVTTCCEVTAHAILWKLGLSHSVAIEGVSLLEAERLACTVLISFDGDDHFALIHEGYIYQSFYKQHTVRADPVTGTTLRSLMRDFSEVALWIFPVGDA